MATRTVLTPAIVFPVPLPRLFKTLVEWEGAFTTAEVSGEFSTTDEFSTPALGALWDADLIDNDGSGNWTVSVSDATTDTAEGIAREALSDAVTVVEDKPKPLTPAQRLKDRKAAVVAPKEGERIVTPEIAQTLVTEVQTVSTPAPIVQAAMENNEHDSDIERNGLYLDAPDFVPAISDDALNAGVSLNVWELAHIAITQTARDSWMRRINKQITEFKAS